MLQVRKDLCVGCGLCIENCPQQAISIGYGRAEINQRRCNQCHVCLKICPQGAIIEPAPVSQAELAITVGSLKQKADGLIELIEKLRQNRSDVKESGKA